MRTLLLSLLPTTENFGIKYIHSYLLSHGHDSAIVFVPRHTHKIKTALNDFITAYRPNLVGIGYMSYEAPFARFITAGIKEKHPGLPVLAGGIHPTINVEECLAYADYIAVGESEDTVLELAERFDGSRDFASVANLAYKDNGSVVRNPLRPYIENLDRLPFPGHFPERSFVYWKGNIVPMSLRLFRMYTRYEGKAFNIISSRGCPFSCSYCCNSFLSKLYGTKRLRSRSPQNFIDEIHQAVKQFPDIILVNIHDDCFLAQPAEWHRDFARDYRKQIARPFIVRSTPLHLTEEKISVLHEAGLAWVTMGLQSGSQKTNSEVFQRRVSNEKFLEATRLCSSHKISGYYDVILDNPFEQDEDVIETIKVLKQVPKPFQLQLFSLTFYKGTEIYKMYKEKFGDESDPDIQNYFGYRRTFLNKLVRITPVIPSRMVDYFVANRHRPVVRLLFNMVYIMSTFFTEPLSFLLLMLSSFRYNLAQTIRIALPTFKTKISERLIRF